MKQRLVLAVLGSFLLGICFAGYLSESSFSFDDVGGDLDRRTIRTIGGRTADRGGTEGGLSGRPGGSTGAPARAAHSPTCSFLYFVHLTRSGGTFTRGVLNGVLPQNPTQVGNPNDRPHFKWQKNKFPFGRPLHEFIEPARAAASRNRAGVATLRAQKSNFAQWLRTHSHGWVEKHVMCARRPAMLAQMTKVKQMVEAHNCSFVSLLLLREPMELYESHYRKFVNTSYYPAGKTSWIGSGNVTLEEWAREVPEFFLVKHVGTEGKEEFIRNKRVCASVAGQSALQRVQAASVDDCRTMTNGRAAIEHAQNDMDAYAREHKGDRPESGFQQCKACLWMPITNQNGRIKLLDFQKNISPAERLRRHYNGCCGIQRRRIKAATRVKRAEGRVLLRMREMLGCEGAFKTGDIATTLGDTYDVVAPKSHLLEALLLVGRMLRGHPPDRSSSAQGDVVPSLAQALVAQHYRPPTDTRIGLKGVKLSPSPLTEAAASVRDVLREMSECSRVVYEEAVELFDQRLGEEGEGYQSDLVELKRMLLNMGDRMEGYERDERGGV